jgi:hypothetical protein
MENTKENEISVLKEILKWLKFAGMNQVKAVLEKELEGDADKIIYQNSDGSKGTVELGTLGGMSKDAVHDRWESWAKMGLGENIPVRGGTRFKRSFDLVELGIRVPEPKTSEKAVVTKQEISKA